MVEGHASASSREINLNAAIGAVFRRHSLLVIYVVDSSVFSKPSVKDVNKAPFPVVNVIADAPGTAGAASLRHRLDTFRAGMSN